MARFAPSLGTVAVEGMRRGVHDHLPLDEGDVDLPAVLRALREDGMESSLSGTPRVGGDLFVSDDLRGTMASFLEQGHGKATFTGR